MTKERSNMFTYFVRKLGKLLIVAAVLSTASALLVLSLFTTISRAKANHFQSFDPLVYGLTWLVLVGATVGTSLLLSRLSARAVFEIRTSLIRRILGTSYERLEAAGTSRLYNVLNSDVTSLSSMFSELPTFVFNVVLLVSCLSYLCWLSPRLFVVLAIAIGVSFLISRTLIARLSRFGRALREGQDAMMEGYKGMLEGSAQLAIDGARKAFYYDRELRHKAARLRGDEQAFRFLWDVNRGVTVALIFLLLGVLMEAGRRLGDQAVVMDYALIVTYLASPFAVVMNLIQAFTVARVSMRKIESLRIDEELAMDTPVSAPMAWTTIRLSGVEYVYQREGSEEPFVLGPLDLEIRRGETLFVTGGNGSGKSTFIKLLLGLHQPSRGHILVDGVPLDWTDKAGYMALFSTVLADFYLFSQVLDPDGQAADDKEVRELLRRFNLHDLVEVRDGVFGTVRLSQGQKKRLALVSAIAQHKQVYVLDEWAADQDPHYRDVFYKEILPWLRASGKTVVAVTHDDRYFDVADRRIDFELGRVRAEKASRISIVKEGATP
ncbi:MAG TPA: cyclic peptide export ABC transporter [Steroidobacteraceae bacterium]|nr:cyclic peptide export ABC transporter [Steroidobacteraceae bacterium]